MDREREEMLWDTIPSFYYDHAPEPSLLYTLMEIYDETIRYAEQVMDEALATMVPGRTPLLHTIPYFKIPVQKAWYGVGLADSIESRDFESQIRWLDKQGYYVPFVFGTNREAKLYALLLRETFDGTGELAIMEDYFIRDNRLYLLPAYIKRTTRSVSHLHAFDLKIDQMLIERAWGGPFGIEPGALLPRHDYRNTVEAYHHIMQGSGTIREIVEAIRLATGWTDFKIVDRHSPDLDVGKQRLYDEMLLSPASFIVTLSEELTKDKVRINIVLGLIESAKCPATHFYFFMDVLRTDTVEPEDERRQKTKRRHQEKAEVPETHFVQSQRVVTEELYDAGRYDGRERYDELDGAITRFDHRYYIPKALESLVAPLNLALETIGFAPCPPVMRQLDETLDAVTSLLGVASEQRVGELEFDYQVRRIQDVLNATGNPTDLTVTGYERFRFDAYRLRKEWAVEDEALNREVLFRNNVKTRSEILHFTPGPIYAFDSHAKYDQSRFDDTEQQGIDTLTLDESATDERPNEPEYVSLTYKDFPEIPREFRREPYYSKTRLVVRPNEDGTEGFILESSDDGVTWVEVERAANEPGTSKNPFTHEIDEATARYYRVKSYAGEDVSLPTLWLDATVLPS